MVKKGSFSANPSRASSSFGNEKSSLGSKHSQITIFVIIALVIVVLIGGYFLAKTYIFKSIPTSISPVYEYYKSCIDTQVKDAADVMASRGGYLKNPDFEPGSTYAPFSNELGFMGSAIPYWSYVSANGVQKEQMPSKVLMQSQLSKYLNEQAGNKCDFSSFTNKGYNITLEDPSGVSVVISDKIITVTLSQKLIVAYQDSKATISSHTLETDSNLGTLYNLATQIYNYEKDNLFLENYTMDVLYTYAPVSGVILNCSPTIWDPYKVIDKLKGALAANIGAIKIRGDYYKPANKYSDYFVVGKNSNLDLKTEQVSFIYSSAWPSRFEVWPTKDNLMVAKVIGTQPGLSTMGFCYSPYKFVYDMYFPVLVQIYDPSDAQQIFQFPLSVVINKNNPNQPTPSEYVSDEPSICQNANTNITIQTYNINLEPVESYVEFNCLSDSCSVGKTKINNESGSASLTAAVPQCVNGELLVKSEGYGDKKYTISTNEQSSADIVLDKKYKLKLEIYVDGKLTNDLSIVQVNENYEDNSSNQISSVSYPYSKEIELTEGNYNFNLMVLKSGSITIPSTTTNQCVKVPQEGVLGLLGLEEEKCTDITVPSQTLSSIPSAGGNVNYYVIPAELEKSKIMKIFATSIKTPTSYDQVPEIYDSLETKSLEVAFE